MSYLTHRPAAGNITEAFGPRPKPTPTSPPIHYGIDFGWGGGTQIYAARSGYVRSYGSSGSYGNRLVIDHGNGWETWYCHLSACHVRIGEYVEGGRHVAEMGATGNVTGKHLHFEVRQNGVAVDPAPLFDSGEEDDMFSDQDRDRLNYVWEQLTKGTEGYKHDGETFKILRDAPANTRIVNAGGALVTTGDMLRETDRRVQELAERPAGAVVMRDNSETIKELEALLERLRASE